jgi:hypothetical protein
MLASGDQYMEILGQNKSTAVYNTKVVSRIDFKNVVDFRPMKKKENGEEKRLGLVDAVEVNQPMEATQEK